MKDRKASKEKASKEKASRETARGPDRRTSETGTAPLQATADDRNRKSAKARAKSKVKAKAKAGPLRRQVGALVYRTSADGNREVLIITSRETRRFVIPKGWPIKKKKKQEVAATEAFEEAGVRGIVGRKAIGRYTYWKRLKQTFTLIRVEVFPLEVREDLAEWPEREQRQFSWLSPEDAAMLVDEPGLSRIIREFD